MSNFLSPGIGNPGGPGFLPSSVTNPVTAAGAQGISAVANRYAQLGLGSTGATPATPGHAADPGGGAAQSTAALMDYGVLPSYTGGLANETQATLGQLQNSALGSNLGKNSSPASIIAGIGNIAGLGTPPKSTSSGSGVG